MSSAPTDVASTSNLLRAVIVLSTVILAGLVLRLHWPSPIRAVLLSAMVIAFGALSWVDVAQHRLPNRITLPMAAISTVAVLGAAAVDGDWGSGFSAIGVGLAFAVVLAVLRFGMGDVKLAFSIGTVVGWLGPPSISAAILVASVSGALAAVVLMVKHRRRSLAFGYGPFLALGGVAGMLAYMA